MKNNINLKSGILPDLSAFPDCEEKRQLINYAQKLEVYLGRYHNLSGEELIKHHDDTNEIWWQMNATMGKLVAKVINERKEWIRWTIDRLFSFLAILVSIIALVVSIIK